MTVERVIGRCPIGFYGTLTLQALLDGIPRIIGLVDLPKMKFNIAKSKRQLDKLFVAYVMARDKHQCQWCGRTTGRMNVAHIIPRTVTMLRWEKVNALLLCVRCHWTFHENPLKSARWIEEGLGRDYADKMLEIARKPFKYSRAVYEKIKLEYSPKRYD